MTENILHDLYYGRIAPWSRKAAPGQKPIKVSQEISEQMEYLKKILSSADWKRISALEELWMEANCLQELDAFCTGFSLGVKLMANAMTDDGLL